MNSERQTPGPGATGAEGCNVELRKSKNTTTTCEAQEEEELRTALLAELRQSLILAKFDVLELERLGIALKAGLISVRQCLALQRDPTTWGAIT